MLDLFCGRLGWSKAFLARGWEVVGVDLVEPDWEQVWSGYSGKTQEFEFIQRDILDIPASLYGLPGQAPDFICASSPCEEFSVHGMKHFHPNPKYPENGIRLFNHTRALCEASGVPWVMENVRAAQQFVGKAVHHCGPFYLWGTGVPALVNQGIGKGTKYGLSREKRKTLDPYYRTGSKSKARTEIRAQHATIPPELANCVADYAERLMERDSND
jgi:hypothetical protein